MSRFHLILKNLLIYIVDYFSKKNSKFYTMSSRWEATLSTLLSPTKVKVWTVTVPSWIDFTSSGQLPFNRPRGKSVEDFYDLLADFLLHFFFAVIHGGKSHWLSWQQIITGTSPLYGQSNYNLLNLFYFILFRKFLNVRHVCSPRRNCFVLATWLPASSTTSSARQPGCRI